MPGGPAIAIHAGAGSRTPETAEQAGAIADALRQAVEGARELLEADAPAHEAAIQAVTVLEDFPLFNAGCGAALCSDGTAELSASLMRGEDRAAGAVAGLHRVRNPILAAGLLLDSEQVLMIGEPADARAAEAGLETVENDYFITEHQRRARRGESRIGEHGTVGAVCLDTGGGLAAATSTGGIAGQPPGRVGDSPLLGAGTWADSAVAVSCTGDGEAFIRVGVARAIAARHERGLEEAARTALAEVEALGASGGLIALDREGNIALPFLTQAMPRGQWRAGEKIWIWPA